MVTSVAYASARSSGEPRPGAEHDRLGAGQLDHVVGVGPRREAEELRLATDGLRDRRREGAHEGGVAAEFLGHHHAEVALPSHLREQRGREFLGLVPLHDMRADMLFGEIPYGLGDKLLLFGRSEIHGAEFGQK